MPRYIYDPASLIDQVTFVENEAGTVRAYLHASKQATDDYLAHTLLLLRKKDFNCTPYDLEGTAVLEVRDFEKPSTLINFLQDIKVVQGKPKVETIKEDNISFFDKLRKRTLQLSGLFYLTGDLSYIKYGIESRKPEEIFAGLSYLTGTLTLALFGRDPSEAHIKRISQDLARHIISEGMDSLPNSGLASFTEYKDQGQLGKLKDFISFHAAEIMNYAFAVAGMGIARSAWKYHTDPKDRKIRYQDIAIGITNSTASLASNLVEEKAPDPNAPPAQGIGKIWDYIKHRPLAIAGYGLLGSTLLHAKSSFELFQKAREAGDIKARNAALFRGVFVGTNIIAELLMAVSSKGHGEGVKSDVSIEDTTYSLAAEIIARQPKNVQDIAVKRIAEFLADPHVLGGKVETIAAGINHHLKGLETNPWNICQYKPLNMAKDCKNEVPAPVTTNRWQEHITNIPPTVESPTLSL